MTLVRRQLIKDPAITPEYDTTADTRGDDELNYLFLDVAREEELPSQVR